MAQNLATKYMDVIDRRFTGNPGNRVTIYHARPAQPLPDKPVSDIPQFMILNNLIVAAILAIIAMIIVPLFQ